MPRPILDLAGAALLVALALAPAARAQTAPVPGPAAEGAWTTPRTDGPRLRVLSEDASSLTLELTAGWSLPLADVLAQSGGDAARLLVLTGGGREALSRTVDLGSRVPPAVEILAADYDDVVLTKAVAEALAALDAPAAEVQAVGEQRRRLVGTLAVRPVHVVDGRLRRYRRLVVRVARPPVRAAFAVRGSANPHLAVTRSRLADGRWFKVSIPRGGVYRVTAAYLRDVLKVSGADLSTVGVYGNGGRILPALNSAPRPADLTPVPALASGDGLLFYAEGPSWWDWVPPRLAFDSTTVIEAGRWEHDLNPFSDSTHVFLRVDDPAPARVGGGGVQGWSDATRLARIEDRLFHEVDVYNHVRDGSGSGLDWLGRPIPRSGSVTRLDTLPPGVDAASVARYRVRVAARANPRMTITASTTSGQVLGTASPFFVDLSPRNVDNLINDAYMAFEHAPGGMLGLQLRASGGDASATAWLDWIEAVVDRNPVPSAGGVLRFATPGGQAGRFEVNLDGFAAQPEVWDVTEPGAIRRLGVRAEGGRYVAQVEAADPDRPREVLAFLPSGTGVRDVARGKAVPNQNLHGLAGNPDYVLVSHPSFLEQAQRLADRRRQQDGLSPVVVSTDQITNEFSGGTLDMRAVRDYVKFLYDRAPTAAQLPRYLLLVGDGHFDYRNLQSSVPVFVAPYETENMFSRTDSYTSDDYFALLGDDEGEWSKNDTSERVDLGVGRIPARSAADVAAVIDKMIEYEDPATRGPWRGRFAFIGDDQFPNDYDVDLHVQNADETAKRAAAVEPAVTIRKIYAPSYPLVQTAEGRRRPQATDAALRAINEGTLVWNYSGHGGPEGLGDEKYLDQSVVDRFTNEGRYPVFVTATCSFGKFDIDKDQSMAEQVLLMERAGGVAMLTTVRVVYTDGNISGINNLALNVELTDQMLEREPGGRPRRLGDALYATKNTSAGASYNNRKFNLLGDPALRLGLPEQRVEITQAPALTAFQEATVEGTVLGLDGRPDASFSGEVDLTVFDAARTIRLPEGIRVYTDGTYTDRTARIYNGRATVQGGRFSTTFLVPQDVSYSGERGRIVAYIQQAGVTQPGAAGDGFGESTEPVVSTQAGARPDDRDGPDVRLFIDDTTFVSGGTARRSPDVVARVRDASGINAAGAGVGHEMLLTVDGDPASAVDVGAYYTGDVNTYRSGTVRYPLRDLEPGPHTAELVAWDGVNNSSRAEVSFVVSDAAGLEVRNVFPYPNPTAGPTRFTFEHNQPPGTPARVQLRVYTVGGRPVRTLDGDEALPGGVLSGPLVQIPWDGRDDDLDRLATGVYLFRLRVETDAPDGSRQVAERVERLAIIR